MKRAAILIGVKRTANLPELPAVSDAISEMKAWALTQNIEVYPEDGITDEQGAVRVCRIKDAIEQLLDRTNIEQLIVYFAGHGISIQGHEYWLLSKAGTDSQEAVNVKGSIDLAKQCTVPHVVFISDSCRTPATGMQHHSIRGSEIFPIAEVSGPDRSVDVFYACLPGAPSFEVKDPNDTAKAYTAVYTDALVDALNGGDGIEFDVDSNEQVGFVRLWPLKEHLAQVVIHRLQAAVGSISLIQTPDANIMSKPSAWLSRLPLPLIIDHQGNHKVQDNHASANPLSALHDVLDKAIAEPNETIDGDSNPSSKYRGIGHTWFENKPTSEDDEGQNERVGDKELKILRDWHQRLLDPLVPSHYETGCGFSIHGRNVIAAHSVNAHCELLTSELVRVSDPLNAGGIVTQPTNVLIVFEGSVGVLLPAIPGFLAMLVFDTEDGALVNISYEPTEKFYIDDSLEYHRWEEFRERRDEIRDLRALVAASTRLGVFSFGASTRLGTFTYDDKDTFTLAKRMQYAKGIDPTMAIYAAYAYDDLGSHDQIEEMQKYLEADLHLQLFDIALLSRFLRKHQVTPADNIFPPFPMLAQGWALLNARQISLPASLAGIEDHVVPSLWTLFDSRGVTMIQTAINNRTIR
jgi:hypothetical protein